MPSMTYVGYQLAQQHDARHAQQRTQQRTHGAGHHVLRLAQLRLLVLLLQMAQLLVGRFSTVGLVVSIVLMLGMTYVGYQLDWSVAVYNELKDYYELSLLDCFRMIPEMLRQEIIDSSAYIGELVKLYAFTLLGAIPTAISSMRSRKLKKVTYRLRSQRTNAAPEL